MADTANRYQQIIEHIFSEKFIAGMCEVSFQRDDIISAAHELGIVLPKNIGDVLYSYRFRIPLPDSIQQTAPSGKRWAIELAGHGLYKFSLKAESAIDILPNPQLTETKVPDATPGLVSMYALSDEQALLAKMRYNRLVDLFTRLNCYSLQNHLRTTTPMYGQVETDEIYVGVNRQGVHFAIPVQAKGGRDRISIVQIEQDIEVCAKKLPKLLCRPIAAQFMANNLIALFEFENLDGHMVVLTEKHYRLVPPDSISGTDLLIYQRRSDDE